MSVKISAIYLGDEQVELTHQPSGNKIFTDLPKDNGGKGRTFSPTDLLACALSSCILTIMGKIAQKRGIDITGTKITVEKIMAENPRRVSKLNINLEFNDKVDVQDKKLLLSAVKNCPVTNSLHPDIFIDFKSN